MGWGSFDLFYVRNKEKEEVDFLMTNKNEPFLLVEAKMAEDTPAKSLVTFQTQLNVPAIQLVNRPGVHKRLKFTRHDALVISAPRWLSQLP